MIEIVTGLPGSGKTLHVTERMLATRKAGRKVLANFHSRKNVWQFGLWEDFKRAENALCVIDEAQMWLNSRMFKTNSIADLAVFQQSRKNGLDLVCIVQHEARLDVAVREVTSYIYKCVKLFPGFSLIKQYTPDDMNKALSKQIYKHRPQIWEHYFTTEVIGERDGKGYELGAASEGGVTQLVDGQFAPTHYRFESDFGVQYVPIALAGDYWERLAGLYQRSRGHFFKWRPFAWVEGEKIWTDEEQVTDTYTVVDAMMDAGWFRRAERIERQLGMIK